jgi:hypothetical protein
MFSRMKRPTANTVSYGQNVYSQLGPPSAIVLGSGIRPYGPRRLAPAQYIELAGDARRRYSSGCSCGGSAGGSSFAGVPASTWAFAAGLLVIHFLME